jgi:hypothetical protein
LLAWWALRSFRSRRAGIALRSRLAGLSLDNRLLAERLDLRNHCVPFAAGLGYPAGEDDNHDDDGSEREGAGDRPTDDERLDSPEFGSVRVHGLTPRRLRRRP